MAVPPTAAFEEDTSLTCCAALPVCKSPGDKHSTLFATCSKSPEWEANESRRTRLGKESQHHTSGSEAPSQLAKPSSVWM